MATRGLYITILLLLAAVPLWADPHDTAGSTNFSNGAISSVLGRAARAVNAAVGKIPCVAAASAVSTIVQRWESETNKDNPDNKLAKVNEIIDKLEAPSDYLILALKPQAGDKEFGRYLLEKDRASGDMCIQANRKITDDERPGLEKDIVHTAIVDRRYGSLDRFLFSAADTDAADTLVQWALLTKNPAMDGLTPEAIAQKIEDAYKQELKDGDTKEPLKIASEKTRKLKNIEPLLKKDGFAFKPEQKEALIKAVKQMQEDIKNKVQPNYPSATAPQLAQSPPRPNQKPNNKGDSSGNRGNRTPPNVAAEYKRANDPQFQPKEPQKLDKPEALVFQRPDENTKLDLSSLSPPPRSDDSERNANLVNGLNQDKAGRATTAEQIDDVIANGFRNAPRPNTQGPKTRSASDAVAQLPGNPRAMNNRDVIGSALLHRTNAGAVRTSRRAK